MGAAPDWGEMLDDELFRKGLFGFTVMLNVVFGSFGGEFFAWESMVVSSG